MRLSVTVFESKKQTRNIVQTALFNLISHGSSRASFPSQGKPLVLLLRFTPALLGCGLVIYKPLGFAVCCCYGLSKAFPSSSQIPPSLGAPQVALLARSIAFLAAARSGSALTATGSHSLPTRASLRSLPLVSHPLRWAVKRV